MNNKILFCLSYAGGTSAFYDKLEACLEPDIDIVKLEYSGHGSRIRAPLLDTIEATVQDLLPLIQSKLSENESSEYAFMGYSMGSIVVLELLNCLNKKHLKCPVYVFLAAHEPMTKVILSGIPDNELDEYAKQRTIEFGGVPDNLLNNKAFWRMYLPLYKADYQMISRYCFEQVELKANIPATIFYSEEDTRYSEMKQWDRFFINPCEYIRFEGKHFFIQNHYQEIADIIKERLEIL